MPDNKYNGHNETLRGGGFHHIALRAFDFDATLKFYMEGLGFKTAHTWGEDGRAKGEKDSRAAMLDTGDGNYLEVFAGREGDPSAALPEGALIHFALRTNDVEASLERARSLGANVTMEPKKVFPPNAPRPLEFHIAFVTGPNGEVIEFFHSAEL